MATIDEFELADERAQPGTPRRPTRSPDAAWPWWVAAVVLVLVGAATARPISGQWQMGILEADLSTAPVEVWRTEIDRPPGSFWPGEVVGDTLVLGGDTNVGLDAETGATLWQAEPQTSCHVAEVLACPRLGEDTVLTIDARTGETTTVPIPGRAASAVVVDGGLVILVLDEQGFLVTRLTRDGTQRWSTRITPAPAPDQGAWGWLDRLGDRIVVYGGQPAVLDLGSGGVLDQPVDVYIYDETLVTRILPDGGGGGLTLTNEEGRTITRPGDFPLMAVDETVDAELSIAVGSGVLSMTDARDRIVWETSVPATAMALARLRGVVVVADLGETSGQRWGYDVATGELLWEREDIGYNCRGSGTTLLCDTTTTLTAVDVRDGSTLWSLPAEPTIGPILMTDRGLFVTEGSEVVAYAWR